MELVDILRNKKMKIREIPKWGHYLRKQWEDAFANHLSIDEKKSIYLFDKGWACGFLWHIFSFEKKECLIEKQAEKAFDHEPKNSCYIFYQHTDDAFIVENAAMLTAIDLLNEMDVYVVDQEFTWTYVKTHETGWCGPYFSRKQLPQN